MLLDSAFAVVPQILAEGRRVIANIERVARLFVTKTVYAAVLAVAIGIAGDTFPFFPRHLTIVSTLAIGIPGFFLALSAGAPRAQAGFTRWVLTFAIPAGIATAPAVLASYALARTVAGVSMGQARTAALLTLLDGQWLGSRPDRPAAQRRPGGAAGEPGRGGGAAVRSPICPGRVRPAVAARMGDAGRVRHRRSGHRGPDPVAVDRRPLPAGRTRTREGSKVRRAVWLAAVPLGGYAIAQVLGRRAGATRAERREPLPGDQIVAHPQLVTDHAITIGAPPEEVWPWLTQLGWHRAGFYTPRWVDRLLFPANQPSLDYLDPGLSRDLRPGDVIPTARPVPPGTSSARPTRRARWSCTR